MIKLQVTDDDEIKELLSADEYEAHLETE